MNINTIILSLALMGAGVSAQAAPSLQLCSPMEVVHNSSNGLGYTLNCAAGGWKLTYSGSVPAGTEEVVAKYRLAITGARGEAFTHTRNVRLPAPGLLGQVLLREAVLLDNGDIALRACEPIGCTQYRPLGAKAEGLTEATITGSQEIIRLKAEVLRLNEVVELRSEELAAAQAEANQRAKRVSTLQAELQEVTAELDRVKLKADSERQELAAQLVESKAQRSAAEAALNAAAAEAAHKATAQGPTSLLARESQFDVSFKLLEDLAGKYETLKQQHSDTLAKLERAQQAADLAATRLEAMTLTQQLMSQNLAIAHADLDAAKHELSQIKRQQPNPGASTALAEKDALMSRITAALVNANVQISTLKEELATAKAAALRRPAKVKQP